MSSTASHLLRSLDSLSTRWQHDKKTAPFAQRLGMRVLEVIALAASMYLIPTLIHHVVQSLDDVYELLGRRARSPYTPSTPWQSIAIALTFLLAWHTWLGRLSYKTIIEDNNSSKTHTSWGRILSRIVIPIVLVSSGVHFTYEVYSRLAQPAPLVVQNTQ
jgi:hypothetical protein